MPEALTRVAGARTTWPRPHARTTITAECRRTANTAKDTTMLSLDLLRELLRELDDPDPKHREVPRDYDVPAARQRFQRLADALERRFGPSVSAGMGQDASFLGVIVVPAEATGTDLPLRVLISNFGPFVTAGTGSSLSLPGCEEGLSDEFVTWLDELCTELGCVYVPVELVKEPYDGPILLGDEALTEEFLAALAAASEEDEGEDEEEEEEDDLPPTWLDRYFDYM
ncbi:hypothetical protein EJ357_14290 [Streptomyces cyaneochromogenes]|uniref:Uncharacterized protein n=1 Tax=Streptomyces cyaneochromogenes TaxID=2496836 RepID=A0A3S9M5R8_9ACTN|nr:hypothetical protein [Streptomyces cyaneochromogenes]AZQ34504.1 hypothetical protein EJ357_14290 [Streptomyces cyaneochromogenes]